MPGQRTAALEWPYVEGLRLDEAMHPLTILAVGLYGKTLLPQNGAPAAAGRAVEVRLQEHQVDREDQAGREAAVHQLEHRQQLGVRLLLERKPGRRSSALDAGRERRIGEFVRRPTLMFNGYGDQVACMYTGMDLKKNY